MDESLDELALFDLTRQRLWLTLADRLPPTVGPEPLLTTYAYWMCWRVKQQRARWEETLHEYTDIACRRAADESEAERREIALLRRKLARTRGPLLDVGRVGAGWLFYTPRW